MKNFLITTLFILFISGCYQNNSVELEESLKRVDREMSDFSAENGWRTAFEKYLDEKGVLLRPGMNPVEGKAEFLKKFDEENQDFTLTWEPLFASAAASGDLGYTYGIWEIKVDDDEDSEVFKGTYVTIWSRDADGNWKMILDTGNEGLDEELE